MFTESWSTPDPLRVRIAIHTGGADLRLGDYCGSVVNRCARSIGKLHGSKGQLRAESCYPSVPGPRELAGPLEGLAGLAAATGNDQRAARLLGAANAIRGDIGQHLESYDQAEVKTI